MTQSVELALDATADAAIRDQWRRLAEAGLPSAQRPEPDLNHRPHITLFAASHLPAQAEEQLVAVMAGLDLRLLVGPVMLFGPRRGACVLVRSVVPSSELLTLQRSVAELCEADPQGQFGPGGWTPHVTLARRVRTGQVGAALDVLGSETVVTASARRCRRWDSELRRSWWLTD